MRSSVTCRPGIRCRGRQIVFGLRGKERFIRAHSRFIRQRAHVEKLFRRLLHFSRADDLRGIFRRTNGAAVCKTESISDCCGDGIMESTSELGQSDGTEPRNFEEFIYKVWGAGIAKHFAIPYNRKLWSTLLTTIRLP